MEGKEKDFSISRDGILHHKGRLCVPNEDEIRRQILEEAHGMSYSVHPGAIKMYKDLRENFWWHKMKNDVTIFVSKCLMYQKVVAEHQRPAEELQKISIPEWK